MYPPGFGIQEQARYFGTARDYQRELDRLEQEREALAERAWCANDYDKRTDSDVIEWRNNYARKLRALRKAKHESYINRPAARRSSEGC